LRGATLVVSPHQSGREFAQPLDIIQRAPVLDGGAARVVDGLNHGSQFPCVDVCRTDGKSGLCVGCFRTRDEIRGWKNAADHGRHQVINDRSSREAKLQRERAG
jgi:uncharacterized protein